MLASAVEILKRRPSTKILILEQGISLKERIQNKEKLLKEGKLNDFDVMTGAGGAGTFSDGKFHFSQALSHYYTKALLPEEEKKYYDLYLNLAEKYCLEIGNLNVAFTPQNPTAIIPVINSFKKQDVNLFLRRCRHVGTDKLPGFVKGMMDFIESRDGKFRFNSEVVDIIHENNFCKGVILENGETILAEKVVLGVGRSGATTLIPEIIKKHDLNTTPRDVLIGGRVAFPKDIAMEYADLMYEFIFSLKTSSGHSLRSFCPCLKGGKVAVENYHDKDLGSYACVNGASDKSYQSTVGNFAFLRVTPPQEVNGNVFEYCREMALSTFKLGKQKPIVQRIKDLVEGRATTSLEGLPKEVIQNLEIDYTLGRVDESYGLKIVEDFREAFKKLDSKNLMKGIIEQGIIVWPEIKFGRNLIIETNKTAVIGFKNLYAIGDGAGNSGNIVGAMVAGMICAHKIADINIRDLYLNKDEEILIIKNYELNLNELEDRFEI